MDPSICGSTPPDSTRIAGYITRIIPISVIANGVRAVALERTVFGKNDEHGCFRSGCKSLGREWKNMEIK